MDNLSWPVPYYIGACGRLIVERDCGQSLNQQNNLKWRERAYLAYQLLQAAKNFTYDHPIFRIYLTDISSDNIVVDSSFKVTFVDLENHVLTLKTIDSKLVYYMIE